MTFNPSTLSAFSTGGEAEAPVQSNYSPNHQQTANFLDVKELPFGTEFQEDSLCLLVRDANILRSYPNLLKPEYYKKYVHKRLFDIIKNFFNQFNRCPNYHEMDASVRNYCERGNLGEEIQAEFLDVCYNLYNKEVHMDPEVILENISSYVKHQELKKFVKEFSSNLEDPNLYKEKGKLDNIQEKLTGILQIGEDVYNIGSFYKKGMSNFLTRLRQSETSGNIVAIPAFPTLTRYLLGGLRSGALYIFCGRPKRGKSTLLINIGYDLMLNGYNVFYYTFELNEEDVQSKLTSRITGLGYNRLFDPTIDESFFNKVSEFHGNPNVGEFVVKEYGPKSVSANTLKAHHLLAKSQLDRERKSVIIVDYPDHMLPVAGEKGSMYEDGGSIYNDLIKIGKELKCPIIGASQPKNEAWDEEVIRMHHLAESSKKAHLAHAVITMNATEEEARNGQMRLFIAANRLGPMERIIYCETNLDGNYVGESRFGNDDDGGVTQYT